jgi:CheY-like chemotaxis protein
MSTPEVTLPVANPLPDSIKKRRVLLVDGSSAKRDLRAEAMRRLGVEVDCATDINEARIWWRADLYNLVLINMEDQLGDRDQFCDDMRKATPPQQLAFLVGKPEYLADVPNAEELNSDSPGAEPLLPEAGCVSLADDLPGNPQQRWGIMEASRRISAVRSVSAARTMAIRNRPMAPRDPETRYSRRNTTWSNAISEFQKEETQ